MAELLTGKEIEAALDTLSSWRRDGDALLRTTELASFAQAIQAVSQIAEIAERDDHHPDIDIRWRTLTFRLATHSAGGITDADVSLARKIDGVIDALSS